MTPCDECGADATDGGLDIDLSGGYNDFLDTIDGPVVARLCTACSKRLIDTSRWAARAVESLNINIGHTCLDGSVHWVAMSECAVDFDRHGWREVWVVRPGTPDRNGRRVLPRSDDGRFLRYGIHDTRGSAEAHAATLAQRGIACRVESALLGNESTYGTDVDPDTFPGTLASVEE